MKPVISRLKSEVDIGTMHDLYAQTRDGPRRDNEENVWRPTSLSIAIEIVGLVRPAIRKGLGPVTEREEHESVWNIVGTTG